MNANFRIGTKYILEHKFTGETHTTPITYLGFDKESEAYMFKNILGYRNVLPRTLLGYYKVTYRSTK